MCVNDDPRGSNAGRLSRRLFLAATPVFLAGCMSTGGDVTSALPAGPDPYYEAMYGAKADELFPLPATDIRNVDERFYRQQVDYHRSEPAGTVVIDTQNRFLYLVQEGGKAMRYGIGVGKAGLEFEGAAEIALKREWPRWTPTPAMIAREPDRYGQYAGGMEPGLTNPLGPRALYLYQNNADTLFRIHGTAEPWSIGLGVSSGCIRLFNQDIIDLYGRVPRGTVVVVLQNEPLMYPQKQVPEWVARQIGLGQQPQAAQAQVQPQLQPVAQTSATRTLPAADVGAPQRTRRSFFGF